ncbi:hypothetical protein [Actinokineospora globicatena]|uniref:hypothetical protein n=1 Tax=Actinokineospora globicatena TaxID=103729 RepID=UPI0020A299CF|nr:hypothetical protein [Actinokineospora globicatena]MCP2302401.1 hypothetical protein [Actinokineospora globicatena]GLW75924.1 hypothetical protein Aglo01_04060 [Actinokineospora globicatena]GLW82764.1 hypothetical protein Aglo02_04040 [Actinokineospora globicatena]
MTDDLAARYEVLRAAAADVVHHQTPHDPPVPYTAELDELYRLLLADQGSATQVGTSAGPVDPTRFSLAFTDFRDDGSSAPYGLVELAAQLREDLAGDRGLGEHAPGEPDRDVHLSQVRALVIGQLLEEVAGRLAPGPAVGMAEAGRGLAELATKLSEQLINMTSV